MVRGKSAGIIAFLVMTFLFSWLSWLVIFIVGITPRSPWFQLAILPSGFSPAVAAIIVRKWITREGFADAALKLNFKQGWRQYLFAWLLPVVVVAFIALVGWGIGMGQPNLTSGLRALVPGKEIPELPTILVFPMMLQFMIMAILFAPVLWGEEFGWRGYLQIRLFDGQPLKAGLATGLIWSVWHFPLILMGYQYPNDQILGLFVFTVSATMLSLIFGWLRLRSGSIWPVSLAHSGTNAIGQMTMILFAGGSNFLFMSYLGILGWIPLGGVCFWLVLTDRLTVNIPPNSNAESPPNS